jgi:hypothetical protein
VVTAKKVDTKTLDLLIKSKELIRKGWCQGRYHKKTWLFNDQYCVLGAFLKVTNNAWYLGKLGTLFVNANNISQIPLENNLPVSRSFNISSFNDNPATTIKDVLAAFDNAIELCKNQIT